MVHNSETIIHSEGHSYSVRARIITPHHQNLRLAREAYDHRHKMLFTHANRLKTLGKLSGTKIDLYKLESSTPTVSQTGIKENKDSFNREAIPISQGTR